jgi:hypothetical protein
MKEEKDTTEEAIQVERERLVVDCGCCMCCPSLGPTCYIKYDESSSCGSLCLCCDLYAKQKWSGFNQNDYNRWAAAQEKCCGEAKCITDCCSCTDQNVYVQPAEQQELVQFEL